MISLTEDKRMLGYELLSSYPDIFHFVTTRRGGYGEGAYESFNCSHYCGDNPEHVRLNRERLLESAPQSFAELVIPVQVHGTRILRIDGTFRDLSPEQKEQSLHGIDALITSEVGFCICVSTADCIPVLIYDKKHRAVAAVHAGWRGTVAYILRETLEMMNRSFGTKGEDAIACIGPGISLSAFEVGEEVYETFDKQGFDMSRIAWWNRETGKHHLDLWEANRMQLTAFGIPESQIELSGICTYAHYHEFFSARRMGIRSGRILSGIMLSSPQRI